MSTPAAVDTNGSCPRTADGKERARKLVQLYFVMLTAGCGTQDCGGLSCVSNIGSEQEVPTNEAAAKALELWLQYNEKALCKGLQKQWEQWVEKTAEIIPETIEGQINYACTNRSNLVNMFTPTASSSHAMETDSKRTTKRKASLPLDHIREIYSRWLESEDESAIKDCLFTAMEKLTDGIDRIDDTAENFNATEWLTFLNVICLNPEIMDIGYQPTVMLQTMRSLQQLSADNRVHLIIMWSHMDYDGLFHLRSIFQQCITLRLLMTDEPLVPNDDESIILATQCLKMVYDANEIGEKTIIPYRYFYNEALTENLDIKLDHSRWKELTKGFSFCNNYQFILEPQVKSEILKLENQLQMRHEMQQAYFRAIFAQPMNPFLSIRIRREYLIRDALFQLQNKEPSQLRKQLRVEFSGEDGVDDGGLRKEFFQLITREIFSEDYGMFTYDKVHHHYWINPNSIDASAEFELVGKILGLAIYNSIILDVRFPTVIYKKLLGKDGVFADLALSHPDVYQGLSKLLEMPPDDIEDVGLTFSVDEEHFGTVRQIELKPGGGDIAVTGGNVKDYVHRYANHILNGSIAENFNAFKTGFEEVATVQSEKELTGSSSNLAKSQIALYLFRAEELELLIKGSDVLDFEALKKVTIYDGGLTAEHPLAKNFWAAVDEMTDEERKDLLRFTTGTDRCPIGGLGRMQFIVAKNGADSDRLPTAHTCFNVLLLPNYETKEKLQERLLKAIKNSEGFGLC
eukprot:Clim_evm7s222 gene=Clim_evmTU7s222